jgi:hypothetical protein
MVQLFQAASNREPGSADRKNDLAAALLLRARLDDQMDDLAAALELLEPLAHGPDPPEAALFNRIYALQCLTLWREAEIALRRLAGPRPPPLGAAMVSASSRPDLLALRRRGEWLLGEWAAHSLRGDSRASQDLQEAKEIGSRLAAATGDPLLSRAVDTILQAMGKDLNRLHLLQHGHADFYAVRGEAIYSRCRPEVLARAEASLATAASPFVGWVRLDQAVCAYFDKDFSRADSLLGLLRQQAARSDFLALQGRAEWMLGLVRMVQARFVEADRHYSSAIALFSRLGEGAHAVYLRSLRAKSYEYGGARREAWRERLAALSQRSAVTDPERLYTMFQEAAQTLQRQGYPFVALEFLGEQMRAAEEGARQTGNSDLLAYTHLARAGLWVEVGRPGDADDDTAKAEEIWSRLSPENESRSRLGVEVGIQRALLLQSRRPEAMVPAVNRGLAFYSGSSRALGDQIEILRLYELRARASLHLGHVGEARDDLLRGIAEVERQRLEIAEMEDRARFLAEARRLFLDLIRLEIDDLRDPLAALVTLERSSNRVLADASRIDLRDRLARLPPSRWGEALAASLPPGSLVVRYGHLPDRLLLWSFVDGRLELEQRPFSEEQLRMSARACRDALARDLPAPRREAACNDAARILLPRSLRTLPPGRMVLLIPDEILSSLPFAALRPSPSFPWLAESHLLVYSPGLVAWLGDPSGRAPEAAPRSALFVADPAFSTGLFSQLPRLPAAREAATALAADYPDAAVLAGGDATKVAVLAALDSHEILQLDGHALANPQIPERGGLLLAPADPAKPDVPSSLLTAADIPPHALRKLRLVVLGACSTGLATYRDTPEVAGLTSTFLARGVPEVIATAWDVPDAASSLLLGSFHRELAAGSTALEALHAAQRELLRSPDPGLAKPRAWAAFQLFRGGNPAAGPSKQAGTRKRPFPPPEKQNQSRRMSP